MRTQQEIDDITAVLTAVADDLGSGWTVVAPEPDTWIWWKITHVDGRCIMGDLPTHTNRWTFRGILPGGMCIRDARPHGSLDDATTEISCTAKKTPTQLATSITRRLLPDYGRAWENLTAVERDRDQYKSDTAAFTQRIADACEVVPDAWSNHLDSLHGLPPSMDLRIGDSADSVYGHVDRFSANSCRVELFSVPPKLALAIVAAINAYKSD